MKSKLSLLVSFILIFSIIFCSLSKNNFTISAVTDNKKELSFDNSITDYKHDSSNKMIVTYRDSNINNDKSNHVNNSILISSMIENSSVLKDSSIVKKKSILSDHSLFVELKKDTDITSVMNELGQENSNVSIQPNYTYKLYGNVSDPYFSYQWALKNNGSFVDDNRTVSIAGIDMNVTDAWDKYASNSHDKEIIIALIDTGIDYTHDELEDAIWTNSDEIPGDGIDNDKNGYIDDVHGWNFYADTNQIYIKKNYEDNHGTHCAGIIAAAQNKTGIAGVASNTNVKIMSLKALGGRDGFGTTDSITKAIKYAKENGASICNISAGTENYDLAMELAMKDSGMLFVIAAGNGDRNEKGLDNDKTPIYPASFDLDNLITVANIACNGKLHSSSNYGIKNVDIAAPGTSIWSTIARNRYGYMSGTSMAAPMVSGILAIIYTYYDDITLMQAKNILLDSVQKLPSLSKKVATKGIPDAAKALSYDSKALLALDTTPPSIKTIVKELSNSYYKKISVTITDAENKILLARYAKGKRPLSYFKKGLNGNPLTLKKNSASITVTNTSTYTIYAKDSAGNETLKNVTVTIQKPTKLSILTKKTLKVGTTYTLKPTLTPRNVKTGLTFTSSNKKVATVNSKTGKILAKNKGTTYISVRTQNGLIAKCKLIVVK